MPAVCFGTRAEAISGSLARAVMVVSPAHPHLDHQRMRGPRSVLEIVADEIDPSLGWTFCAAARGSGREVHRGLAVGDKIGVIARLLTDPDRPRRAGGGVE